jgi:ATP-dependent Clp protease ATP-binding subunit ClpB
VGKTAIVEDSPSVLSTAVPETLKDKRVLSLDIGDVARRRQVSAASSREAQGGIEGHRRRRGSHHRVHRRAAHMVGAGKAEGAIDAGNMLKPALAQGELHCVGATTPRRVPQVHRKGRRPRASFPEVLVDEPSVESTIAILRGLQERYEIHHGVEITDPAIVAAAELSHRYITDRFLPDKAIDLIDEAAARIKMEIDSKPEAMDRLDRRLIQLKIEREAVKKEKDPASKKRLELIEQEIAKLEREYADLDECGVRKKPRSPAPSISRKRSTRSSSRWKKPSAKATGRRCRSCNTANFLSWRRN